MGQVLGTSVPRIDTLEKMLGSGKFAVDMFLLVHLQQTFLGMA